MRNIQKILRNIDMNTKKKEITIVLAEMPPMWLVQLSDIILFGINIFIFMVISGSYIDWYTFSSLFESYWFRTNSFSLSMINLSSFIWFFSIFV